MNSLLASKPIPIPVDTQRNSNIVDEILNNEYSLHTNMFDPSKSSPPNEFMKKLQLRMNMYNSYFVSEGTIFSN